ncbi:TPA: hypothetical protein U2D46_001936 [Streptococcus suis]|uniref:hypothetical protein n=1 Tax=Streptococcus suis TaxID=1307 RepID=UPI001583D430|nr:hypothetical protein [Streptococcus suis]MCK3890749.1 hypothetical protein [Streptococcus suis]HEM6456078.1 hypothetical protein [Streptococcus suis]HEM6472796.1 hypothetical protein [Streptococcus suis]
MFDGVGIPCGHNPVVLGSIVDEDKPILGEERILFYGDIMFGPLIKIRRFYEYESLSLKKLWNDYNDQITDRANLYLVVTNALNGTIYACGHSKRGEWTVFAKTAGYA